MAENILNSGDTQDLHFRFPPSPVPVSLGHHKSCKTETFGFPNPHIHLADGPYLTCQADFAADNCGGGNGLIEKT